MHLQLRPRGVLIALEGIDGAGKTTQAGLLEEWLRPTGIQVIRTKEPTDGPWGRLLRESASKGRLSPSDELHAFLEDRREHVTRLINPGLQAGGVVIVDRYYFSTAAYQGVRGHDPEELIRKNEEFAPPPDLLVLLDISPREAIGKIRERGDTGNLFEREEDLSRSAAIFAKLSPPYLLKIDGTRAREAISSKIVHAVFKLPAFEATSRDLHGAPPPFPVSDKDRERFMAVQRIVMDRALSPAEKVAAVRRRAPP